VPPLEAVDIRDKFELFQEHWRPKIVAELNGQEVKLAKFQGEFVWHSHAEADELFLVWRGRMRLELRERVLELGPGELVVVPRGVEHRTAADEETWVLIFEPAATRNTGEVRDERLTAPEGERI
jgi:mannose-6-phosphate isomerase-like protein (cupin superfamily)